MRMTPLDHAIRQPIVWSVGCLGSLERAQRVQVGLDLLTCSLGQLRDAEQMHSKVANQNLMPTAPVGVAVALSLVAQLFDGPKELTLNSCSLASGRDGRLPERSCLFEISHAITVRMGMMRGWPVGYRPQKMTLLTGLWPNRGPRASPAAQAPGVSALGAVIDGKSVSAAGAGTRRGRA